MAVMECNDGVKSNWNDSVAPGADGLYDPSNEKEACGVGFVVQIDGIRSNKVRSSNLIKSLCRLGVDREAVCSR